MIESDRPGNRAVVANAVIESEELLELRLRELRLAPHVADGVRRIDPGQPFVQGHAMAIEQREHLGRVARMPRHERDPGVNLQSVAA